MQRRARVLLMCDVVDSTAITERLGDALSVKLWRAHDSGARALLTRHLGLEIDKTDGMFALFDELAHALAFAADYHDFVAALDPPLSARVALHHAEILLRQTPADEVERGAKPFEVDGIGKPTTARIGALALPGQTLLSESAAQMRPSGTALNPLGHWRFKGVSEPVALFEPKGRALGPPPDAEKAWRVARQSEHWLPIRKMSHSLPAERDRFVGRRQLLTELAQTFADGSRLVSLLGLGGTGKTRMALHHGWEALGGYPGGVWFCDLSQAGGLEGLLHAVAQGIQLPLSVGDPVQQIGSAIAARGSNLVVLDNFEQLVRHAEDTVGRWLSMANSANFLVTSRESLGIVGERTVMVPPMPDGDGIELFVERARDADSSFRSDADGRTAIGELVSMLDGLPLAVELAASRVRVMSPREMLSRMSERFQLLAKPGKQHDRQATLRATLEWSWELLSAPERLALAQLSIFEGGFSLAAAEAVVDLQPIRDAPWIVDVVHALVQKSLVRSMHGQRFDLLRTVQDFARMELAREEGAAVVACRRRHAGYFSSISEREATAWRCADADNLVAACRFAIADGSAPMAAMTLGRAWAALRLTGPFSVALGLADAVLAMAGLETDDRARAVTVWANALDAMGRGAEALQPLAELVVLLPAQSRALPRTACVAGEIASNLGQFEAAEALLSRSLEAARAQAEAETQCRALNALGWMSYWRARFAEARTHYRMALDIAERLGDQRWKGGLLGNLGALEHTLGHHAEAQPYYEQSLALAREVGDRRWEANALSNLGLLQLEFGHTAEAQRHLASALTAARHMGHRKLEATVLCNLGHVGEALGESPTARIHYEQAVDIAHLSGDLRGEGIFRAHLGLLLARLGQASESRLCLELGSVLLQQVADSADLALLRCKQAQAEVVLGDPAAARHALSQAEILLQSRPPEAGSELAQVLEAARRSLVLVARVD